MSNDEDEDPTPTILVVLPCDDGTTGRSMFVPLQEEWQAAMDHEQEVMADRALMAI